MKLLVNTPTGLQEIIEIGKGGGYFDAARVVWDERTDGPMPELTMGGMKRGDGRVLTVDAALLSADTAKRARKADKPVPLTIEQRLTALEAKAKP